ncbi:TolC family protein [Poriferisphaera corsica]|nr:TolC family protein [Poriferisphaera corsica]
MSVRQFLYFPALTLAIASLYACTSAKPFSDLDWDAKEIISQNQKDILGRQAVTSPLNTDNLKSKSLNNDIYSKSPRTNNPDAHDLPVDKTDPNTDIISEASEKSIDPGKDATRLNLEDIIAYALENSPEYKNEKEGLYLQALSLITERHQWGPRFFSTLSGGISGTPEAGDHDLVADLVQDLRVTQKLPYGGDVSIKALVNYVNYLRSASDTADNQETQKSSLSVSFNLPLLRGAGLVAQESIIAAERSMIYAVRDFERFRRSFIVDLCTSYFNLLRQQQSIENSQRRLENLERLSRRFKMLAEKGREPFFQYERAQGQVLSGKSSLSNAIDSYQNALDNFKITIGMPTQEAAVIEPAEIVVPEPALKPIAAIQAAYEYRLDFQTQRDRVDDTRRRLKNTKNRLLPDLNLSGSVGLNSDPDIRKAGFQLDAGASTYNLGASLEIPLDRVSETADYRSALINLERAERNFRVQKDRIAQQVRSAIRDIKQARFSIQLQEQNVKITERRLTAVRLRERTLGPREVIDVLDELNDAREERDRAITNLRTSILSFLLTTGQMRVSPEGRWISPGQLRFDPQLPPIKEEPEAPPADLEAPVNDNFDPQLPPFEENTDQTVSPQTPS